MPIIFSSNVTESELV